MSGAKTERLCNYLREQVESGTYYFKSREVAEEIPELSPKQIGTLLRELSDKSDTDTELDVSKWAGESKATTWRVSPR